MLAPLLLKSSDEKTPQLQRVGAMTLQQTIKATEQLGQTLFQQLNAAEKRGDRTTADSIRRQIAGVGAQRQRLGNLLQYNQNSERNRKNLEQ